MPYYAGGGETYSNCKKRNKQKLIILQHYCCVIRIGGHVTVELYFHSCNDFYSEESAINVNIDLTCIVYHPWLKKNLPGPISRTVTRLHIRRELEIKCTSIV